MSIPPLSQVFICSFIEDFVTCWQPSYLHKWQWHDFFGGPSILILLLRRVDPWDYIYVHKSKLSSRAYHILVWRISREKHHLLAHMLMYLSLHYCCWSYRASFFSAIGTKGGQTQHYECTTSTTYLQISLMCSLIFVRGHNDFSKVVASYKSTKLVMSGGIADHVEPHFVWLAGQKMARHCTIRVL